MSMRGQAATSQQAKPGSASQAGAAVGASSVMLQSAMQYNCSVVSNKKPDGKSMMGGPMDKKDVERQSSLAKQDTSKFKNETASMIKKDLSGRKCFIMRHGERLDRVFPGWMQLAFSETGRYKPYDLNMPMGLPVRVNYGDFANDGPMTEVGYITSQMCGRAMRMSGHMVDQIYCSPALRCLQAAHGVLKGAKKSEKTLINVEPGLFEYLSWYKDDFPVFLTLDEAHTFGYEVNRDYKPVMSLEELRKSAATENIAAYYKRSHATLKGILEKHPDPSNVLVLAHGPSLDACSREMLRRPLSLPTEEQMGMMGVHFPYCSVLSLQEYVDRTIAVVERLLPNISYYEHSNRINGLFFNRR